MFLYQNAEENIIKHVGEDQESPVKICIVDMSISATSKGVQRIIQVASFIK